MEDKSRCLVQGVSCGRSQMSGLWCQLKNCGKAASSCLHRAKLQERFIEMENGVTSGLRKKCLLGKAGVFKWASYCFSISHNPYYIIVS